MRCRQNLDLQRLMLTLIETEQPDKAVRIVRGLVPRGVVRGSIKALSYP